MTDFSIHGFGSLTNKLGKEIKVDLEEIKKFDADGDARITQDELENYVKSLNDDFDATEINKLFRALDKDATADVDENEFAVYDQKIKMQETADAKLAQIAADPKLAQHAANIRDSFKELIEKFADSYSGDVSKMSEEFPAALEKELEGIKADIKAKDPETIQEKILEEMNEKIANMKYKKVSLFRYSEKIGQHDNALNKIMISVDNEANKFRTSYKGDNFEADLREHLEKFINQTDVTKMAEAKAEFEEKSNQYGSYISVNELKSLKTDAAELLKVAVNQGVTINLNGTNIKTEAAIQSALAKYTSGNELIADITECLEHLSDVNLIQKTVSEDKAEVQAAKQKTFTDVKGEEYKVNANTIDFTKVDERYFTGEKISKTTNKQYTLKNINTAKSVASFVKKSSSSGGILRKLFSTSTKTITEIGTSTQKQSDAYRLLSSNELRNQVLSQVADVAKAKSVDSGYLDDIDNIFNNAYNQSIQDVLNADKSSTIVVKDLCDNFIAKFNENFAAAINDTNKSKTDFDTDDLDLSSDILNNTKDASGNTHPIQQSNGKTADVDFGGLYASGANLNVNNSVSKSYSNQVINGLRSQIQSKAKAMCTANNIKFDSGVFITMFNTSKAVAVNAGVKGNSMNTRTLVDTFVQNFKDNYTVWVDGEKNKTKQS